MTISRGFALLLLLNVVGCATLQDTEYCAAQKWRAHQAWYFGCDERCTYNPFSHYAAGWRKGYSDVLLGGDGECPPVPPQCYWSHKYQSERGECAIENWFLGYSHGATEALASCRGHYSNVPLSDTFRECGPECLGNDFAPYDHGRTSLGIRERFQAWGRPHLNDSKTGAPIPNAPPTSADQVPPKQTVNDQEPDSMPAAPESNPGIPPSPAETPQPESTRLPKAPPAPESTPAPMPNDGEPSARTSGPALKMTKATSMTKKWSNSMITKLSRNPNEE